jgi:hypothetical protein
VDREKLVVEIGADKPVLGPRKLEPHDDGAEPAEEQEDEGGRDIAPPTTLWSAVESAPMKPRGVPQVFDSLVPSAGPSRSLSRRSPGFAAAPTSLARSGRM